MAKMLKVERCGDCRHVRYEDRWECGRPDGPRGGIRPYLSPPASCPLPDYHEAPEPLNDEEKEED